MHAIFLLPCINYSMTYSMLPISSTNVINCALCFWYKNHLCMFLLIMKIMSSSSKVLLYLMLFLCCSIAPICICFILPGSTTLSYLNSCIKSWKCLFKIRHMLYVLVPILLMHNQNYSHFFLKLSLCQLPPFI